MATTYVLKRKSYASVRNPHLERKGDVVDSGGSQSYNEDLAEDYNTEELDESNVKTPVKVDSEMAKNKLAKDSRSKTPVYQNLKDTTRLSQANDVLQRDSRRLRNRNRTVNQNININRNTNISNPDKVKAAEMDARVKMQKMSQHDTWRDKLATSRLIEIQKTNPLKPLSMD